MYTDLDDLAGAKPEDEIISEFSWNSRVAAGELHNLTDEARRAGIGVSLAITSPLDAVLSRKSAELVAIKTAWNHAWCVRMLLNALREAMMANRQSSMATFDLVLNRDTTRCVAILGPKGPMDPEAAITIMLQEEYDD